MVFGDGAWGELDHKGGDLMLGLVSLSQETRKSLLSFCLSFSLFLSSFLFFFFSLSFFLSLFVSSLGLDHVRLHPEGGSLQVRGRICKRLDHGLPNLQKCEK